MTSGRVARALAALTAGGVALLATGCGGEDEPGQVADRFRAYCEEVEEQRPALSEALGDDRTTGLIRALPIFEELRDVAPDDIRDDWDTVIDRISDLVTALEEAGVDPEAYDRRNPPPGLTREERARIEAAAVALVAEDTALAMGGVQQHARDVCKTPLTL